MPPPLRLLAALMAVTAALLAPQLARAGVLTLPVPAVTIYPGDVITQGQLTERRFAARQAPAAILDSEAAIVGKVARRTLLPGKPIAANALRDPHAVNLGGTILAVYRSGGLTITSRVQPLRAGSVGEVIEARNPDSGKVITGTVQADGSIRIGSP